MSHDNNSAVGQEEQELLNQLIDEMHEDDVEYCQRMQVAARDFMVKYTSRKTFPHWYSKNGKGNHRYLYVSMNQAIERIEKIWREYDLGRTLIYGIMASTPSVHEDEIKQHRIDFMLNMDIGNHSMPI